MKNVVVWIFWFVLISCFPFQVLLAQNWDVNFVRSVNPEHPNSIVWKGLSSSVYPISVALPAAIFVTGTIDHNKLQIHKAYESAGSVVISAILAEGLKKTVRRDRPYQTHFEIYPYEYELGESFPSGHTTLAFATATTLALEYKKWYIIAPAYVWATGAGFSRLYLGEHYTTDVLAGAAIGTGSALISHWLTKKIFK